MCFWRMETVVYTPHVRSVIGSNIYNLAPRLTVLILVGKRKKHVVFLSHNGTIKTAAFVAHIPCCPCWDTKETRLDGTTNSRVSVAHIQFTTTPLAYGALCMSYIGDCCTARPSERAHLFARSRRADTTRDVSWWTTRGGLAKLESWSPWRQRTRLTLWRRRFARTWR